MAIVRDAAKNVLDRVRRRALENDQGRVLSPMQLHTLGVDTTIIMCVAFLPDNEHVVSGGRDGTVRKWRVTDGREVGKPMNHGSKVYEVAVSADGGVIASGGGDGKVIFWNCKTCEKLVESQEKHSDWIGSLSFGPDSQTLMSTSIDGSIMVWSVLTGERVAGSLDDQLVWSAAFSPSPAGNKIAGVCDLGVRVWDGSLEKEVIPAIPVKTYILSLVWSSDGHQVIGGDLKGKIHFFDSSNGDHLATCRSRTGPVISIAVSQGGAFLASASVTVTEFEFLGFMLSLRYFDSTVRLWSTSTHQQLASLKHSHGITTVSISLNGQYLAAAGWGGLYIWRLQEFDPTEQENKPDSAASNTDASDLQPTPVNSDDPDGTASLEHATQAQDREGDDNEPQGSETLQAQHLTRTASMESWLDMPAVLAAPTQTVPVDGNEFFGKDVPSAPLPESDNVRSAKWEKKARGSGQYLFKQLRHFRDALLSGDASSDTNSTPQSPSSRKLKDRIHRIRRRSSIMPENAEHLAEERNPDQQGKNKVKSPKLKSSFVAYGTCHPRIAVASNDPPAQQEKWYFAKRGRKVTRKPDPSVPDTSQQQTPQPTPSPNTVASPSAQSPTSGDSDIEVCVCCGFRVL